MGTEQSPLNPLWAEDKLRVLQTAKRRKYFMIRTSRLSVDHPSGSLEEETFGALKNREIRCEKIHFTVFERCLTKLFKEHTVQWAFDQTNRFDAHL